MALSACPETEEALRLWTPCCSDCPKTVETLGPCPEDEARVSETFPVSNWRNAVLNKLLALVIKKRLLEGELFMISVLSFNFVQPFTKIF